MIKINELDVPSCTELGTMIGQFKAGRLYSCPRADWAVIGFCPIMDGARIIAISMKKIKGDPPTSISLSKMLLQMGDRPLYTNAERSYVVTGVGPVDDGVFFICSKVNSSSVSGGRGNV